VAILVLTATSTTPHDLWALISVVTISGPAYKRTGISVY